MDKIEIQKQVEEITKNHLSGTTTISSTDTFTDLGADSLDLVEIIMELEEKFGIEIPDSDAEKIATIEDATNYIFNKQNA